MYLIFAYNAYTAQMSIVDSYPTFEDRFGKLNRKMRTYNNRVNGS